MWAAVPLATPALACERECLAPVQLPPGAELPGNMLYFKLLVDDPGELSLHTAAGVPVAAAIRSVASDRVFVPDAAVVAGTELVLEYTSDCGVRSSYAFLAAPHGALELRPAALVIDEQGVMSPGQPGELSFVRLQYYSPDANGVGYALMSQRFTLDGDPAPLVHVGSKDLIEVAAACNPSADQPQIGNCGIVRSVAPGVHRVVATTTIVGQETQPEPVALDVTVSCPGQDAANADGSSADLGEDLIEPVVLGPRAGDEAHAAAARGCALAAGSVSKRGTRDVVARMGLLALLLAGAVRARRRAA